MPRSLAVSLLLALLLLSACSGGDRRGAEGFVVPPPPPPVPREGSPAVASPVSAASQRLELRAGFNMIALPVARVTSLEAGAGVRPLLYAFADGRYETVPLEAEALNEGAGLSRAFWLYSDQDSDLLYEGEPLAAGSATLPLEPGFNLVRLPVSGFRTAAELTVTPEDGPTTPLPGGACSDGSCPVYRYGFRYAEGAYAVRDLGSAETVLSPGEAMWVHVGQSVSMAETGGSGGLLLTQSQMPPGTDLVRVRGVGPILEGQPLFSWVSLPLAAAAEMRFDVPSSPGPQVTLIIEYLQGTLLDSERVALSLLTLASGGGPLEVHDPPWGAAADFEAYLDSPTLYLRNGQESRLALLVRPRPGRGMESREFDLSEVAGWSADGQVATVSNQAGRRGVVRGQQVGTGTVWAEFMGQVLGADVEVGRELVALSVQPAMPEPIPRGSQRRFKAWGRFDDGSVADLTDEVRWSTADLSVLAPVDAGVVLGVDRGTSRVLARAGDVEDAVDLVVERDYEVRTIMEENVSPGFSPMEGSFAGNHLIFHSQVESSLEAHLYRVDSGEIQDLGEEVWAHSVTMDGRVGGYSDFQLGVLHPGGSFQTYAEMVQARYQPVPDGGGAEGYPDPLVGGEFLLLGPEYGFASVGHYFRSVLGEYTGYLPFMKHGATALGWTEVLLDPTRVFHPTAPAASVWPAGTHHGISLNGPGYGNLTHEGVLAYAAFEDGVSHIRTRGNLVDLRVTEGFAEDSDSPSVAGDPGIIAFESRHDDPEDPGFEPSPTPEQDWDVFVYYHGARRRVSVDGEGDPLPGPSRLLMISGDGRFVLYWNAAYGVLVTRLEDGIPQETVRIPGADFWAAVNRGGGAAPLSVLTMPIDPLTGEFSARLLTVTAPVGQPLTESGLEGVPPRVVEDGTDPAPW